MTSRCFCHVNINAFTIYANITKSTFTFCWCMVASRCKMVKYLLFFCGLVCFASELRFAQCFRAAAFDGNITIEYDVTTREEALRVINSNLDQATKFASTAERLVSGDSL